MRRLVFATAAVCAVLLALLAALHLFIVPRVDDARPWVEQRAAQALGVPLRIGALEAHSQWLGVTVSARDVCLPDAGDESACALHIPHAAAVLSLPSLLRARTVQLVIEKPELALRRTADGRLLLTGMDISAGGGAPKAKGSGSNAALDWVFSQPEWVMQHATLHYTDEQHAETLTLHMPQLVLHNNALGHHDLQLDAAPENATLGGALTLQAQLRSPALSRHAGRWQEWSGPLYLSIERLDGAHLARSFTLPDGWQWRSGHGALRLWARLHDGAPAEATLDAALRDVDATLGESLEPLLLPQLAARVQWLREDGGHTLAVQRLHLGDATRLDNGELRLHWRRDDGGLRAAQLNAAQLELGALADVAAHLPLPEKARDTLAALNVQGRLQEGHLDWQHSGDTPGGHWNAKAQLTHIAIASQPAQQAGKTGIPGISGADVQLEATHEGGQAQLAIADGALEFPGVFEEPRIPLDELNAKLRWNMQGGSADKPLHLSVEVPELTLKNADATGRFAGGWRTFEANENPSPWPGVLTLEGQFARANGARVYRYLPLAIAEPARRYVQEAIRAGEAHDYTVRIKGDARRLGKPNPPEGTEFLFTGPVQGVVMDYVPAFLQPKGQARWPALQGLQGTLTFEHAGMRVTDASAEVQGHKNWRFTNIQTDIADFTAPVVQVRAAGSGALAAALGIVRASPAAALTSHAMDSFKAEGNAALNLELDIPIKQPQKTLVRGSVDLQGNTLRLADAAPPLTKAQGRVRFSETGFALENVRAQALGGSARASGGMGGKNGKGVQVKVTGNASAEGIAQMQGAWGSLAALANNASGSMNYQLALGFPGGSFPAIHLESDTRGLALNAPTPFAKNADESWPLRFDWQPDDKGGTQLDTQLGIQLALRADFPSKGAAHGTLALGGALQRQSAKHAQGLHIDAELEQLDVAEWSELLAPLAAGNEGKSSSSANNDFMPGALTLHAGEVRAGSHTLHDVRLSATRSGALWRADARAKELAGAISYNTQGTGRVTARLQHLHLDTPKEKQTQQENAATGDEHRRLPALDVQVQDLRLNSRALGRLALNAGHEGQHWRINTLELHTPEATLAASGQWSAARGQGARLKRALDVRDGGALLTRFAMPGVIARSSGNISGELHWDGAPWQPHWPTLGGQLKLDLGKGQFLKADPGIAKLLGVLSLQSLPRRLTLDFRDIFSTGFAFDSITGDVNLVAGSAITRNLRMSGPQALVAMEGSANLVHETQDLRVLIVPNIDAGAAALAATAINPVLGLSAFLAQLVLQKPLAHATTRQFAIEGTWKEPRVTPIPTAPAERQGNTP